MTEDNQKQEKKEQVPITDSFQIVIKVPRKAPLNEEGWNKYEIKGGEMKFVQEFCKEFYKHKGKIIDVSNILEKDIEQVIVKAKKQMSIPLKYDEFGTFSKNYTFLDKWEDFRKITKDTSFPIKKDYKELRKNIFIGISIRNKYTHGELIYDGSLRKFFIEYNEDGKKEAEVDNEIIKKEVEFICNLSIPVREISNEFDRIYLEKKK